MQVKDVVRAMEAHAQKKLKEEWDNVGLMLGNPDAEVGRILLALTPSEAVVAEAVEKGCKMIVSHHPFIFKGMKNITTQTALGRMVYTCIKNDIAVYSAHTNLDIARGGVNDVLAQRLGLQNICGLVETSTHKCYKLVVFVPETDAEAVKSAMFAAGAGEQGAYKNCAWQSLGSGQFLPLDGAHPHLGDVGQVEHVDEMRLEVLVDEDKLGAVEAAMLAAHPYEEVAFDVFESLAAADKEYLGRMGTLPEAKPLGAWLKEVKTALGLEVVSYAGREDKIIERIAVCGGSACEFLSVAQAKGCDVYVTGDMKYHDAQQAVESDMCMVDASHYGSERPVLEMIQAWLKHDLGDAIEVVIADNEESFIKYQS